MMMLIGGGPKGGDEDEKPSYGKGAMSDESGEEEGPGLAGMARKKAAKNVMRALEAGDVNALDKALAAHYEACSGE